jgi:4,5-dihydroxyphthalate decarboxylase
VDLSSLRWLTFEPAHVDGYEDPANCSRAAAGKTLLQMTLDGEVDAAIGLEPDPRLRPLLPPEAESEWLAQGGVLPINHVLAVKSSLVEQQPWLPSELYLMFSQARDRGIVEDHAQPAAYGLSSNRAAIERLAAYAHQQGIIPRQYAASELFEPF